ncbi:MAG: tRNA adenosine(34) deaminase TadA [Actinomycetota bacterium]|jgi:tRNA(adenine34) deaminase|nr:tRNA adenosine(34) deaminase TadA [Acidimicrobiales bacterium]MCS5681372.1 tRNA adenosine(34) deaminase TadA [Acidimicrobiales bacterium]MEC7875037.1 tRNA adenosine(34) deaminase TadA [Actinomycetota bacterium]MEC8829410.1 tRNA adenosine(34) deaminase TadA [Actinomycetota bacterium]MEC9338884.1 tRNA adenosine(34) deaminase TadA [Actinomycetota bacterium]
MNHDQAMRLALTEARAAVEHEDVPVGALVIVGDEVVSSRHNERQLTGDPTAHAEILALRDAANQLGTWRLDGATLVSTLEPCPMCAGGAVNARIGHVVFGAHDPKAGAVETLYNLLADPRLNHQARITSGVLADECGEILTTFFAKRR